MKSRKNNSKSGFTLIEVIITLVIVAVVAAMMTAYFGTGITQSSIPIFRLSNAAKLNEIMEKITAEYNNTPPTWSPNTTYAANTTILPTAANRITPGYQYITIGGGISGTVEPTWPTASGTSIPLDNNVQWTYNGSTPPPSTATWTLSTPYNLNTVLYHPDNGRKYTVSSAGTSNPTVPSWSETVGATITDGGVTWTCGLQPTLALQTKIGAEVSGGADYTQTFGDTSILTNTPVSYRVIQNRFINFNSSNIEESVTTGNADYGKYLKVTIALPMSVSNRTEETMTTLFVRR